MKFNQAIAAEANLTQKLSRSQNRILLNKIEGSRRKLLVQFFAAVTDKLVALRLKAVM